MASGDTDSAAGERDWPPASTSPLVELDRVSITHVGSQRRSPDGVSFTIGPGEVVLLLGPSGSGKSTLSLALNGLIPHAEPADFSGTIVVAGRDTRTTTVAELSRSVAMVFQDPDAQLVTATVLDEVCFGPENLLVAPGEVLARAERALRLVGLWERRGDDPAVLSGGGRQRLAIAAALTLESPLIVLDEPTANLDPEGIAEVHRALAALVASRERSVLLIEHNLDSLAPLVDRVLVIDGDGCLVADAPTDTVLRGRATDLHSLGVWLPVSTLAALRFRAAGVPIAPLPLTPTELAAALDAVEEIPPPAPPAAPAPAASSPAAPAAPAALPHSRGPVVVSARALDVCRRRTPLLQGVSLDIHQGDFVAIVGANGAGKTTLLEALAGVVKPPRGRVQVLGLDPATTDPVTLSQKVGFVFQNPEHQFVETTVADELRLGLRRQGLDASAIEARTDDVLRRFALTEHRDAHPFRLSGGQKRRLSVGTALVSGATVLALDEPTFGQDRERAAELLDLLDELNVAGTTVIVVSHDMQLVADHASHVVVLGHGRVLAHDTVDAVLSDGGLLARAGLRPPPLAAAFAALTRHPQWHGVARMSALPSSGHGAAGSAAATSARDAAAAPSHPQPPVEGAGAASARAAAQTPDDAPPGHPDAAPPFETARTNRSDGTAIRSSRSRKLPTRAPLARIDPLATVAAVLPALVVVLASRDIATPLVFAVVALAVLAVGARLSWRVNLAIYIGLPLFAAVSALSLAVGTDPALVSQTPTVLTVAGLPLKLGALELGVAASLRLVGVMALALVGGATTSGPELVRSLVLNARVPYRFGYAALAAFRFVPRFGHELQQIRAAHRVRGVSGGRGPVASIRRTLGYAVPLLAGAIRHAERVALAMESRAFGAHPTRTERVVTPLGRRDALAVALGWAATVVLFIAAPHALALAVPHALALALAAPYPFAS